MLAEQRNKLEIYAKEHGFEIVVFFSDIGSDLTMERLGPLDFHTAAKDGKADVLLVHNLTRLGRDADTVTRHWCKLCDFGFTVHAADCGEIDLSLDTILRG